MQNSCSAERLLIATFQTLLTQNLQEALSEHTLYQK